MAVDWTTDHLTGTNERRVLAVTSAAAPSINVDVYGALNISALAVAITSIPVTGTPNDLQELVLRILSPGAHAIAYGAAFENVGATAPVITVAGKRHTVTFLYDAVTGKFGCVDAKVEA